MKATERVAVVTGGNRGMGPETARRLAQAGVRVVLTARDERQGRAAESLLRGENLPVAFHPLVLPEEDSVSALVEHLRREYGRLDVLINNAGAVLDPQGSRESSVFQAEADTLRRSFETNTLGPFLLSREVIPLMRQGSYGRVVNVSTGMAALNEMNGGYPGYRMSKTALNALTRILADELKGENIKVNAVCPGWVRTQMGGASATRSVEEGVDTTVWLAQLPDDGPSGGFFRDRKPIPW